MTATTAPRQGERTRTRNRPGEGSVKPRADGHGWRVRWTTLSGQRGERYAPTEREGRQILRQMLASRDLGAPIVGRRHTLASWMRHWYPLHEPRLQARSRLTYSHTVDAWVTAPVGRVRLVELRPEHVSRMLAVWARDGLGARTCRLRLSILRMALEAAYRADEISRNVARIADMPPAPSSKAAAPPLEDLERLRAVISTHPLEALWTLALDAGMRQGEILALQYRHIDWANGIISVEGTLVQGTDTVGPPKSDSSRRALPVDAPVMAALARHRDRTPGVRHHGHAWVFSRDGGRRPLSARLVLADWHAICREAGVPRYRMHDLRHAFVSAALAAGVPLKRLSGFVGHSSVAITGDVYGHLEITRLGIRS